MTIYTDRIIELGATPSTGTVGDSYDNALAEAINALYKTELIRQRGPLAHHRAGRARDLGMGVVVQQPTVTFRARLPHPRRSRGRVLR